MRIAFLVAALSLTRVANAQEAPPSSPPTARFELLPPAEEPPPVADESRSDPHTVPKPEWVPLSNSTDYGGGFDRPWPDEPEVERRWYGWQTLAVDAVSIGVLVSAADSSDSGPRVGLGVLGYTLGGPIIHAAHGHLGKALGSLGLRVGAPVVGAVIGFAMEDCGRSHDSDTSYEMDFCGLEGAAIGFLVGTASAVVLDATVVANEDVEPDAPSRPETGVQLRPDIRVEKDRAQLSLSGSF